MRFPTLLSILTTVSVVSSLPTADPAPVPAQGKHTGHWDPTANNTILKVIRVKDIDPNATNGDLIVGKVWKHPIDLPTFNTTLEKRQGTGLYHYTCYNGPGAWAAQSTLWNAIGQVCTWVQTYSPIENGQEASVEWDSYQDDTGYWHPISDVNYIPLRGMWRIKVPYNGYWDWNTCYNLFFDLVWNCKGSNPDTAGGYFDNYSIWSGGMSFWYP
ncbi:hypothetical protein TWF694_005274 [Orbilia ellipsospora]|uniref:Uncharacterized protein n=1 Tax=Orbilia ellipsospora TaxID=2528407 RepID=A0AAV9WYP7_9PEZI